MKFTLKILFFLLAIPIYSQGFNWQYSSRLPQKQPILFFGLHSSYSLSLSRGSFPFVEDRFICCEFESGIGRTINIGINSEYWLEPLQAINLKIAYSSVNSDFIKIREFPVILHGNESFLEQYQYDYSTTLQYLSLKSAYRYKFEHTQFSVAAGINFSYLFSENNTSTESRIGPSDKVQLYTRTIQEGIIEGLRSSYFAPELSLAYDFSMRNGLYSSVAIYSEIPIISMTHNSEWRMWQFGINFAISRGILLK